MTLLRRSFLKQFGILSAGSLMAPTWLKAASENAADTILDTTTRAVVDFVSSYSEETRLVGAGALARAKGRAARVTRVLARVPDVATLTDVWSLPGMPPGGVYAQGNRFSFVAGDAGFEVENLLPGAYGQRTQRGRRSHKANFAHDALLVNPNRSKAVFDPLGATNSNTVILVNPGANMIEAVNTMLTGWVDSSRLRMPLDEAFARLQARLLDAAASRPAQARKILRVVVHRLANLAAESSPKRLRALFKSRLIRSSLAAIRGAAPGDLLAEFDELRAAADESVSDAALWIVVLFGEELADGILDGLASGDPDDFLSAIATQTAFGEAQTVVANGLV